jgi:hypothetical protein
LLIRRNIIIKIVYEIFVSQNLPTNLSKRINFKSQHTNKNKLLRRNITVIITCTKCTDCEQQQKVCGPFGLIFLSDWKESVSNKYERLTTHNPQDQDEKINVHWKYNIWNHNKRIPTVHMSQTDVYRKTRIEDPHQKQGT